MPAFAFVSPTVFVGAYDLTNDLNKLDGSYNPNFLDATTFGSGGWRTRLQGLIDVDFMVEGFNDFSATGIDADMAPLLGSINVVTVTPNSTATAGNAAYLFRALAVGDHAGATVGELATVGMPFKGQTQMVSGFVSAPQASRTATGSASVVQAGTSSSGQIWATRHVFSAAGGSPTLASWIEQATNAAMIGAVTRVAFSTATSAGGEWVSASITTTAGSYWRASWVFGGTNTPTFDFGISFAIR
jgi:hypothetical protein